MSHAETVGDGSSRLDARDRVVINASDEIDQMRYRCPNHHSNWSPTNSHIWCQTCARQTQHDEDIEAEYYEVLDKRHDELIPWSAVEFQR